MSSDGKRSVYERLVNATDALQDLRIQRDLEKPKA